MKIINLKTNRIKNPLGFDLASPRLSYQVVEAKGKKQKKAVITVTLDNEGNEIIYQSEDGEINSLAYTLPITLKPRTRYFWYVEVWSDKEEYAKSDIAWFETAKIEEPWQSEWITSPFDKRVNPVFIKEFNLNEIGVKGLKKDGRIYICGLGMYEIFWNGKKVGDEYFAPGCTNYEDWLQYQTYDISSYIEEENCIEVYLADGWYKGRFGLDNQEEIYGDQYRLMAEIHLKNTDGEDVVLGTNETWYVYESPIIFSGIYDGEIYDPEKSKKGNRNVYPVLKTEYDTHKLRARLSVSVRVKEEIEPISVIHTPAGETVLDMGQNMAGVLSFLCEEDKGTKIQLQFGEILQNGNFYRDNLRSAKAEYTYISDGKRRMVSQHFTYYGFRYVKVEGFTKEIATSNFKGLVLYSDLEDSGEIYTNNVKVNQLISNAKWGQKGNFIDVPTDCPQRDERLGWTGDAQVFCSTACYQMDSYPFYNKYLKDLASEQKHTNGAVPHVIPAFTSREGSCSVWGDAATIIPWTLYQFYGDIDILKSQYASMKAWVEYVRGIDEGTGGKRLWSVGFHFGDWLGLDNESEDSFKGGTDDIYIASAFYYYSTKILAKAAKEIRKESDAKEYDKLANEILSAIRREYFTPNGRLAITTQTGYVLALYLKLMPEGSEERIAKDLYLKLRMNRFYLKTGFVGTAYLCKVLSEYGYNDTAYQILLNEEYPSWLYAVNLGATTVWERWNSVLPDGSISGTGMNSLNHYSYGAIVDWMYQYMAGIQADESNPGFKKVIIRPRPNYRIQKVDMSYRSASGVYQINWEIKKSGEFELHITVPFDSTAILTLPNTTKEPMVLEAGEYQYSYLPEVPLIKIYDIDTPMTELIENEITNQLVVEAGIDVNGIPKPLLSESIRVLNHMPFVNMSEEELEQLNRKLVGHS